MPPLLPRRNLLAKLGGALAATGAGGPFAVAQALASVGATPRDEDVTRPPGACPGLFGRRESAMNGLLTLIPKAAVLRRSLGGVDEQTNAAAAAALLPAASATGALAGGRPSLARWTRLLAGLRGADPMVQLVAVNRFANAVPYVSDRRNYGVEDYWAKPAEFFAAGGDCEDFALVKFISLRRLGFHEDRLRIAIVFDEMRGLHHGFLAVYLAEDIYVLDNQIEAVTPHRQISHYSPICAFDSRRLWVYAG